MNKILIVGCGHWGQNYIRIFSRLLGADAMAIVDADPSVRAEIKKQYPGCSVGSDLSSFVGRNTFSRAVIATPAATHFKLVDQCLEAGLDVLAEKPLTLDLTEAEKLAQSASDKDLILMVGHTFLFNPAIRKMRELIDQDICGDIYYMKASRTHLGLIRNDVNVVWDLAPHDVSIFNYLIQDVPNSVSATGGCYLQENKEDVAFITLQYPNNIMAHIHVSWVDSNKERTVKVVGSRARLIFDDLNALEQVKIIKKGISTNVAGADNFGEFLFALRDGEIISPLVEAREPLVEVCQEFLRCTQARTVPLTDPKTGMDVVRIMCAINKSLKNNGEFVAIT